MAPRLPNSSLASLPKNEVMGKTEEPSPQHPEETETAAATSNKKVAPGNSTTDLAPSNFYDNSMMGSPSSAQMMYNTNSSFGAFGGGTYGGAFGGGFGMMGSPYFAGGVGPLSGLNQFLFGIQNLIFSLGQAVQIVGMNTQALQQLLESATTMVDHAIATWHEMQTIDKMQRARETEEEKKRRRRLRALRWALVVGVSYAGYKLVRYILSSSRRKRLTAAAAAATGAGPYQGFSSYSGYSPDPYYGGGVTPYGAASYGAPSSYGGYSPYGNGMY